MTLIYHRLNYHLIHIHIIFQTKYNTIITGVASKKQNKAIRQ